MSGEYGDGDFPLAVSVGDLQIEVVAELVVYSEVEEGVLRNELGEERLPCRLEN